MLLMIFFCEKYLNSFCFIFNCFTNKACEDPYAKRRVALMLCKEDEKEAVLESSVMLRSSKASQGKMERNELEKEGERSLEI